jgi:hypothetical protein
MATVGSSATSLRARSHGHGLVFAQPEGHPWRPDRISRQFKRLMTASGAAAGFTELPSLKVMRSTMVTNLHGGTCRLRPSRR